MSSYPQIQREQFLERPLPSSQYFDNDLLKRITDTGPAGTLFDRQYSYNSARQISQIIEPTRVRTFGYDQADRLTSVTDATHGNESYSFDDVGNRLTSHLASTYGYQTGQFNRLISATTPSQMVTYSHDANGNTTTKSEGPNFWRYTWDYENRLAEASTRKQKVRYKFDALGRRVERNQGFGKERTKFTYDGDDVVVDDSGGTLTKYLNGEGIDNKLRVQSGSTTNYFLADHLGSTNGLADPTGALVSQTAYDSFGNQTGSLAARYGFTGREYDAFTGLHFYRARWYDGKLGRFITEDPIGFSGGDINLYGYVRNQPQWYRDPFGLEPGADVLTQPGFWQAAGALFAGAGAAIAAAASSPAAVALGGLGAGYAIGYYPGQLTANHPSNPFVNGPWNPFGTPYPGVRPLPPTISAPSTARPYCQPVPRAIPFYNWPPIKYPIPLGPYPPQTPEKDEECFNRCQHLIGASLDGSAYRKCYRTCMGTLWE